MSNPFRRAAILASLFPWVICGCALLGRRAPEVHEIHLFGLPTALTLPGTTMAGGVGVRVYASEGGGVQGLPIRQGRLDVLLFDAPPDGLDPRTTKPLRVWSFSAPELAQFESASKMGTGYQMELMWDQDRPKGRVFTVIGRYQPRSGSEIYSSPAAIGTVAH